MKQPTKPQHGQVHSKLQFFELMVDENQLPFVRCDDGVLVVPLTARESVLLAVEYSPAFNRKVLQLVGGTVKPGESLEECANRELQEELWWRANHIEFLCELHPFRYLTARQFIFIARDLVPSKLEGDEIFPVEAREVRLDSFTDLCASGELQDTTTIAALYMVRDII